MVTNAEITIGMLSRTQILQKLVSLQLYRFHAYIEKIDSSTHVVRFYFPDGIAGYTGAHQYYVDFYVREMAGYLSAQTIDGIYTIDKLV